MSSVSTHGFSLEAFRLQAPRVLESNALLQRQAARESNARTYPRRIPLALQQAHGIYVQDTSGQLFMDCLAGAGTLALGHNHPVTLQAMRQTLDSGLPLHTRRCTRWTSPPQSRIASSKRYSRPCPRAWPGTRAFSSAAPAARMPSRPR